MIVGYLRLALFALGLLIGVQVPGFLQSYAARVDAHRLEALEALGGFNETAGRFFAGDLQALLAHYQNHQDPVMQSDANSLERVMTRTQYLERQWQLMRGSSLKQAFALITKADNKLLQETRTAYRYQVLLEPSAIAWGLSFALLFAWLIEGLVRFIGWLVLPKSYYRPNWR